ncbi:hypothetical protein KP509_02G039300 [Ceratopteris richardii]|uniref:Uncharacterized protein n=1 Tax=Ceratopteris richardii TaxID=49495 RepID=A0A8T2VCP3_CERRI|nr:hypothetical protein KP509_02G039300 [Ceratopteris richardii]
MQRQLCRHFFRKGLLRRCLLEQIQIGYYLCRMQRSSIRAPQKRKRNLTTACLQRTSITRRTWCV